VLNIPINVSVLVLAPYLNARNGTDAHTIAARDPIQKLRDENERRKVDDGPSRRPSRSSPVHMGPHVHSAMRLRCNVQVKVVHAILLYHSLITRKLHLVRTDASRHIRVQTRAAIHTCVLRELYTPVQQPHGLLFNEIYSCAKICSSTQLSTHAAAAFCSGQHLHVHTYIVN
jgi:hypothetical protein